MRIKICLLATLLCPVLASAEVLLERVVLPGYTLEEYAAASTCTIDDRGQMSLSYRLGGDLFAHRVQQLQIPVPAIRANIKEAAAGKLGTESMAVDGTTYIYRAHKRLADGGSTEVILYEENGGSGQKRVNDARAATKLRNFLDLNCTGALQF